jgi:hypothetical protein
MAVAGTEWRERNGETLLNGCSISNKEDEKVLEMENGDGCTTM